MTIDTQAQEYFSKHRRIWEQKPVLRRIYEEELFARLLSSKTPGGISIEIGGGPGFFKKLFPEVISTDLISCPWLDVVADAQALPFQTSTVTNVLGLDVLHHLAAPMKFLQEAERILVPGGRLVLVEPWITPFSRIIYRYFHQEDCDLAALPSFQCIKAEPFCLFAYLLSFGFKPMSLLPEMFYPGVSRLERLSLPLWRRFAALRVLLALEKSRDTRVAKETDSGGAAPLQR